MLPASEFLGRGAERAKEGGSIGPERLTMIVRAGRAVLMDRADATGPHDPQDCLCPFPQRKPVLSEHLRFLCRYSEALTGTFSLQMVVIRDRLAARFWEGNLLKGRDEGVSQVEGLLEPLQGDFVVFLRLGLSPHRVAAIGRRSASAR
jgi:hypothetical protein